jgi:hypothetical protein
VSLDTVHHGSWDAWVGDVGNGVHPGVDEMLPDLVLEGRQVACAIELGGQSGLAMVVPFLRSSDES